MNCFSCVRFLVRSWLLGPLLAFSLIRLALHKECRGSGGTWCLMLPTTRFVKKRCTEICVSDYKALLVLLSSWSMVYSWFPGSWFWLYRFQLHWFLKSAWHVLNTLPNVIHRMWGTISKIPSQLLLCLLTKTATRAFACPCSCNSWPRQEQGIELE